MLQVCGIKKQEGEYNNNSYKNYVIYAVDLDHQDQVITGVCPVTIKIKQSFYQGDIKELYKKNINVYYDSYGKVAKIEVM